VVVVKMMSEVMLQKLVTEPAIGTGKMVQEVTRLGMETVRWWTRMKGLEQVLVPP
jgi:hypothetical protein